MNRVFVDTSAFLALLVADDHRHAQATKSFAALRERAAALVTTSYVLVETYALLDRRVGRNALRRFREEFEPLLEIVWGGRDEHEAGFDLMLAAGPRLSFVDAVSVVVARDLGVEEVFAYDPDFGRQGFRPI